MTTNRRTRADTPSRRADAAPGETFRAFIRAL